MFNFLKPSPTLSERDVQRTLLRMRWDAVTGGAMFSIGGGGFMAAYALALGASNLQVGILAALPPVSQVIQLPAILLIEKFRARKAIAVPAWFLAQFMWLLIGCVPFLLNTPGAAAVTAIIFLLAVRGLFTSVYNTSVTSWVRDLVPQSLLGRYYSRRFGMMTVSIAVAGLGGSFFVSWWQSAASPANDIYAYSLLLVGGWAVFGIVGPLLVAGAKEPLMPAAQEDGRSTLSILMEPLQDRNFSRLIKFLVMWNFALNMAVPFFAVYMLTRLGFSLPIVIGFTIVSQVTNVLFIRVWGAMADRTGSKTVLSLAASLYLLVIFGWMFTTNPDQYILTIPLLAVLHVFAGIAAAGVQLTIQTLALKIGPRRKGYALFGYCRNGYRPGSRNRADCGRRFGGLLLGKGLPNRPELVDSQRGVRASRAHSNGVRLSVSYSLYTGAAVPELVGCIARGRGSGTGDGVERVDGGDGADDATR